MKIGMARLGLRRCLKLNVLTVLLLFFCLLIFCVLVPHTFNLLFGMFYYTWIGSEYSIEDWMASKHFCGEKFVAYGNQFAVLQDTEVYPTKPGIFCFACLKEQRPSYTFFERINPNHLNSWMKKVCYLQSESESRNKLIKEPTVAVNRYEYANIYHQMTDWYNIFVQAKLMGYAPESLNILIIDKNPKHGLLDGVWNTLFKNVSRLDEMIEPVTYSKLIWAVSSYNSPLLYHQVQNPLPYIEDFRIFFTRQHKISADKVLNCSKLNIVFLWRQNYISHFGNLKGKISRKIANEHMLIESVKKVMPGHVINEVQLEKLTMLKQLEVIASADMLIGMHGAGMTHILFLPPHAGVLEFFPNYWINSYPCFKALAKWRKLQYLSWTNTDPKNEFRNSSTLLSPNVVQQKVKVLYSNMCSHHLTSG